MLVKWQSQLAFLAAYALIEGIVAMSIQLKRLCEICEFESFKKHFYSI